MTQGKKFAIRGFDFTIVKNPTGTGGYVLACQTPEPTFITTCPLEDAETEAEKYVACKEKHAGQQE